MTFKKGEPGAGIGRVCGLAWPILGRLGRLDSSSNLDRPISNLLRWSEIALSGIEFNFVKLSTWTAPPIVANCWSEPILVVNCESKFYLRCSERVIIAIGFGSVPNDPRKAHSNNNPIRMGIRIDPLEYQLTASTG